MAVSSFLSTFILLFCSSTFLLVLAADYKIHDHVSTYVNTVGPFHNPAEVYSYYDLPYCAPKQQHHDDGHLGEVLAGDRRKSSLYEIRFNVDLQWQALCHFELNQNEIKRFVDAIKQHYIFEMFVDNLSIKGFVGEIEEITTASGTHHVHNETHYYLFTHLDFSIAYNHGNVIAVNLTTDPQQRVELAFGNNLPVEFSYSVHWIPTNVPFVDRLLVHSRSAIGDQAVEIHWLSIINSFVLVILLTAFLAVILMRVLHKDFARYMELDEDELDEDNQDEVGWKLVHGDVFRYPKYVMFFSALIGNGAQMLVLIVSLLILALVGTFYPGNRGALYTAAVVLYALTSCIAGYVATSLYMQLGGTRWATNAVLTASTYAVPFFLVFIVVNCIAWYYGSTSALPFGVIFVVVLLWALVAFPLTIFGSMRAKVANSGKSWDAPCKTNRVEREIPPSVWYRHPLLQMIIAGFLPFSAIYIELHYIFAAVWGHRVYTLFGILSLAFVMLIIVTAFITVALTYFQLASEDYHWWWRSFLSGSSTGIFMYVYAIFYYTYRSEMSGILQGFFFFGYMAMISFAFSLMLGAVSYWMAAGFVRHIYRSIKID